jgi:prepilin-type N-terminal cleavage/methylation domain-containing protein
MNQDIRMIGRADDGFTLIELLIVIVILGVLAGVTVFAVQAFNKEGQEAACQADKKNVEVAAEAYYAKENAKAADVTALVTKKYLKEVPRTDNGYTISINSDGEVIAAGACT